MRAIKLTPPRPKARASKATNRRRLCSLRTGAICWYRLRAARAGAGRIMPPSYVGGCPHVKRVQCERRPRVISLTHAFMDGPLANSPGIEPPARADAAHAFRSELWCRPDRVKLTSQYDAWRLVDTLASKSAVSSGQRQKADPLADGCRRRTSGLEREVVSWCSHPVRPQKISGADLRLEPGCPDFRCQPSRRPTNTSCCPAYGS